MNDKEKMLNGELYNPNGDETLVNDRLICKKMCFAFNNISPDLLEERKTFLRKIIKTSGINVHIESPFNCDYGYNISVGENFYANHNLVILDPGEVTFGDNVFIGPYCTLATGMHSLVADERRITADKNGVAHDFEYGKPIKIGNDVWLASNVTICGGVTIGDGSVIGAGSVVTKNIPSGVLAAGNPCRVIREITEKDSMYLKAKRD